jgi:hypothetical protein
MILFGPEIYRHLAAAMQHEWLETNGLGGCASSTLIGLNTQRSHGLLTAALPCGALCVASVICLLFLAFYLLELSSDLCGLFSALHSCIL